MAVEQITQDITIPDEPPSSRDRVNFRPRADVFVAWMKTFATQISALIPKINSALTWINTNVQNALTYSQTATTQASIATTKASEAAASATAAYNAQIGAEAALDAFDDKYLGAKSTLPTVDNDGNPLQMGATVYKDSSPKGFYVYDTELATWQQYSFIPTAHSSLSGRGDADAHPISAITGLVSALAGKQYSSEMLTALATLATAANKLIYATGSNTFATTDLSAFARTMLDDTSGSAMFSTMGFLSSVAANGYFKLPNGLILQWGSYTASFTHGSSYSITFPMTFPNSCLQVVAYPAETESTQSGAVTCPLTAKTTSGFTFQFGATNGGTMSATIRYFAIGY